MILLIAGSALAQEDRRVVRGLGAYLATAEEGSSIPIMQQPPLDEETSDAAECQWSLLLPQLNWL